MKKIFPKLFKAFLRKGKGFFYVRPAGRTNLVVEVHYSPGKGKS
jgi:hypothetical protein